MLSPTVIWTIFCETSETGKSKQEQLRHQNPLKK